LLEEDAFVGGVLVEQDKPPVGLQDDVKASDDADQTQRDLEERGRGDGWGGGNRGGGGSGLRGGG